MVRVLFVVLLLLPAITSDRQTQQKMVVDLTPHFHAQECILMPYDWRLTHGPRPVRCFVAIACDHFRSEDSTKNGRGPDPAFSRTRMYIDAVRLEIDAWSATCSLFCCYCLRSL